MGTRARLNGHETDAFSRRARKWLKFRAGQRKSVKQRFWRKERKSKETGE